MDIKDIRHDPSPIGPAAPVPPVRDDGRRPSVPADGRRGGRGDDRVDISAEARALAEEAPAEAPEGVLPPDRLVDLRRQIQARFYDQPEVAEQVARRIIERGDL